jgi:ADP-ribose pyrophosphatase YjhB (NUDIX family)
MFRCPDCGFLYYHNTAAATGLVVRTGDEILLVARNKEPARGKLGLPGGFINPGEGAFDGLRRECREELSWDPGPKCVLFASFPNVYPFKNIDYNTCDLFFAVEAPGLRREDLTLDAEEIAGILFVKPGEINFDDIAFESTRRAIQAYLEFIALQ